MKKEDIIALIIALGPAAFQIISDLMKITKSELTVEEVLAFAARAEKTYEEYIAEAGTVTITKA